MWNAFWLDFVTLANLSSRKTGSVRPSTPCCCDDPLNLGCARRFAGVITATPAIGERFQKVNPTTMVLNNFPWLEELSVDDDPERAAGPPRVVYVGGISRERGVIEMVQAMGALPADSRLRLDLVGRFENPALLEEACSHEGWARVDYHGPLPRPRAQQVMRAARIGLIVFQAAPNNINAQPNKMFEYMSAGLAMVASNFRLWNQLLSDPVTGIGVNPLEPADIAAALVQLEADPTRTAALGTAGRDAIRIKFNWNAEEVGLHRFVDQIVGS